MRPIKIFIAGGGTGGHIYPALSIAKALQKAKPSIEIHFVGTEAGLEKKIIPQEGLALHLIQGGKLNYSGGWLGKLLTLFKLPMGLIQSFVIIAKHRPQFILGVGGYASGPFVLAGALSAVSTAIWEANALPGMANRWLSFFVDQCFVVFDDAKSYLNNKKILTVGMPVRSEIERAEKTATSDGYFHLLSFGGSQGARFITTVLSDAIIQRGPWTQNLKVVHQIGSLDYAKLQIKYKGYEDLVSAYEFIYDMPKHYAWADLVVSRGGAGTIAELSAFGVAPIIIPLPAADNHQKKNAEELVKAGAAVMIEQSDLSVDRLIEEIQKLRNNKELRQKMSANIKKFFKPHAAEKIAAEILGTLA